MRILCRVLDIEPILTECPCKSCLAMEWCDNHGDYAPGALEEMAAITKDEKERIKSLCD